MAQAPQPPQPPPPRTPPPSNAPPPRPQNPNPGPPAHANNPPKAEPKAGDPGASRTELERKALDELRNPKDFKLPKPGSKDYIAGQPTDDKELQETKDETDKRIKAAQDAKQQGGTTHEKFASQYGETEKK